jgi:hypothetical protein
MIDIKLVRVHDDYGYGVLFAGKRGDGAPGGMRWADGHTAVSGRSG